MARHSISSRTGDRAFRAWLVAWLGGAAIGSANGALRETTYGRRLPEPAANAVSAVSAIGLFALFFRWLGHRWALPSQEQALRVGLIWGVLTICFEFALGRAAGKSWSELGAEYDMRRGRLWPLVLLSIVVGPGLARRGRCR